MRIAVANSHRACIGGAETYLDAVIPALATAGHQIAFFSELAFTAGRTANPPTSGCAFLVHLRSGNLRGVRCTRGLASRRHLRARDE